MSDLAMYGAAVRAWPQQVSRDPELREPQLSEQMELARSFVTKHLVKSEAATVELNSVKVVAEAVAGRWVSTTALLATLLGAGFQTKSGKQGAVSVRCRPRDLRLVRALRRGRVPTHHELTSPVTPPKERP